MFLCVIIFQQKYSQSIFSQNISLFLLICFGDRSSHQRCSAKKLLIKYSQYSQEKNYVGVSTQVFSCEYRKMFKNTYFEEHLRTAAFAPRHYDTIVDIIKLPRKITQKKELYVQRVIEIFIKIKIFHQCVFLISFFRSSCSAGAITRLRDFHFLFLCFSMYL